MSNLVLHEDVTEDLDHSGGSVTLARTLDTNLPTNAFNNIGNSGGFISISGNIAIGTPNLSPQIGNNCNITIGGDFNNGIVFIDNGILSVGGSVFSAVELSSNAVFILPNDDMIPGLDGEGAFIAFVSIAGAGNNLVVTQTVSQTYTVEINNFNFITDSILFPAINGPYNATFDGLKLTVTGGGVTYIFEKMTETTNIPDPIPPLTDLVSITYTYVLPAAAVAATDTPIPTTVTADYYYFGAVPIQGIGCICLAKGTNILTDTGYVKIEDLQKNDNTLVLKNNELEPKPIQWIGKFNQNTSGINTPTTAPIRIKKSALADNIPSEDLLTSPGHAILIDGHLIQAQHLVNGKTIYQDTTFFEVTYYHVKLDAHYIINANGVNTESYFDLLPENRKYFENGDEIEEEPFGTIDGQMPDFLEMITTKCAAPLVLNDAERIASLRQKIDDRAAQLSLSF